MDVITKLPLDLFAMILKLLPLQSIGRMCQVNKKINQRINNSDKNNNVFRYLVERDLSPGVKLTDNLDYKSAYKSVYKSVILSIKEHIIKHKMKHDDASLIVGILNGYLNLVQQYYFTNKPQHTLVIDLGDGSDIYPVVSVIQLATRNQHPEVLDYLLSKIPLTQKQLDAEILMVIKDNKLDAMKCIINRYKKSTNNSTEYISEAVRSKHAEMIKLLVTSKFISKTIRYMEVIRNGINGDLDAVKLLHENGISFKKLSTFAISYLEVMDMNGHIAIVKYIIENGYDITTLSPELRHKYCI